MQQDNEFYIGWQAEAPKGVARMVRRYLLALALIVPAFIALVGYFQRGFSNAVFEYGKSTELEGVLNMQPIPFLTVKNGMDAAGKPVFQNILLVGPGKFGFAQSAVSDPLPDNAGGNAVRVKGFLIYHDGKTALEVSEIKYKNSSPEYRTSNIALGTAKLRGEITDPKCLLGVMNPGRGKPHRDCAARCIAGGIPPLLKVANADGDAEYYLVVGPEGEALNRQLLDFAADGVEVSGRLEQQADWLVLYADPGSLKRIDKLLLNPGTLCR